MSVMFVCRWTPKSCDIVCLRPNQTFKYQPSEDVKDVVNQQTVCNKLNENNYVHQMHNLLWLEQLTQERIINRLL
jgi:hypothetical protein